MQYEFFLTKFSVVRLIQSTSFLDAFSAAEMAEDPIEEPEKSQFKSTGHFVLATVVLISEALLAVAEGK